jgi:hypothetical protein
MNINGAHDGTSQTRHLSVPQRRHFLMAISNNRSLQACAGKLIGYADDVEVPARVGRSIEPVDR